MCNSFKAAGQNRTMLPSVLSLQTKVITLLWLLRPGHTGPLQFASGALFIVYPQVYEGNMESLRRRSILVLQSSCAHPPGETVNYTARRTKNKNERQQ